ncbi:hypothetical protein [Hahella sp. NBU794]|uniref:hypothetical protein n=1 Tax=Hahella sp. NBU794 TaxID=3422590 RepID=UPI003D6E71AF
MSVADSLIDRFVAACGTHCKPYILIEPINEFPESWDEDGLRVYVNGKLHEIGCVEVNWKVISYKEMYRQLRHMLTVSLVGECPPFFMSSEETVNCFIEDFLSLVDGGCYLSNARFVNENIEHSNVFKRDDRFSDLAIVWISAERLAVIAHRGFD